MNKERIEVGDIVNVHFTTSRPIWNAKVLYVLQNIGEEWQFSIRAEPINVILFERMDLVRKGEL